MAGRASTVKHAVRNTRLQVVNAYLSEFHFIQEGATELPHSRLWCIKSLHPHVAIDWIDKAYESLVSTPVWIPMRTVMFAKQLNDMAGGMFQVFRPTSVNPGLRYHVSLVGLSNVDRPRGFLWAEVLVNNIVTSRANYVKLVRKTEVSQVRKALEYDAAMRALAGNGVEFSIEDVLKLFPNPDIIPSA